VFEVDADGDSAVDFSINAAGSGINLQPTGTTTFDKATSGTIRHTIGAAGWQYGITSFITIGGFGPTLNYLAPSATVPTVSPASQEDDTDTGMGTAGTDIVTLIAGAAEAMSLHEGQLGSAAGDVVMELFDVVTAPTSNPAAGDLFLYVDSDSVWIRNSAGTTTDLGAAGGSPAFNTITTGTNTTATMTVGSGAVILPASGGIIEATETVTEVYNNTGATIEKCAAVYISGFNVGASLPEVTVADADTVDDGNPAIGLVQAAITTATAGYVAVSGEITGVDTSVADPTVRKRSPTSSPPDRVSASRISPLSVALTGRSEPSRSAARAGPTTCQTSPTIRHGSEARRAYRLPRRYLIPTRRAWRSGTTQPRTHSRHKITPPMRSRSSTNHTTQADPATSTRTKMGPRRR
jgi:hypothetical protein